MSINNSVGVNHQVKFDSVLNIEQQQVDTPKSKQVHGGSANDAKSIVLEPSINAKILEGANKTQSMTPKFAEVSSKATVKGASVALNNIVNTRINYTELFVLLSKLDTEEIKRSSETVVYDILNEAQKDKDVAKDLRSGAGLALAGAVVSSSIQLGASAVSIGGGIKGFSIVSEAETSVPTTSETPESELNPSSTESLTTDTTLESSAKLSSDAETTQSETSVESSAELEESLQAQEQNQVSSDPESVTENQNESSSEALDEDASAAKLKKESQASLNQFIQQNKSFILSQRAQSIGMVTQGISGSLQALAGTTQGLGRFGSDTMQAQSKEDEADSKKLAAVTAKERAHGKTLEENLQKLTSTLDALEQARHDTATRTMA